ncbi:MAG: ABC transporter ATP-binding protein [Myxococcota bacterium]
MIKLENITVTFEVKAQSANLVPRRRGLFFRRSYDIREIKAIDGLSLAISNGERVGIIGANGAGKTTLLKVIAGIYAPKSGEARVEGRVCPLFEFVTGFEMEAAGWENIKTRALLLGMDYRTIKERIKEIGEFTELGEFLDVPVRHYSSGMLLRLAFATSTSLDPDVLLLDEVMAAGDIAFVEKAKKRMNEFMNKANIVVFVSHSLDILPTICPRIVWLDRGKIAMDGEAREVIEAYRSKMLSQPA